MCRFLRLDAPRCVRGCTAPRQRPHLLLWRGEQFLFFLLVSFVFVFLAILFFFDDDLFNLAHGRELLQPRRAPRAPRRSAHIKDGRQTNKTKGKNKNKQMITLSKWLAAAAAAAAARRKRQAECETKPTRWR